MTALPSLAEADRFRPAVTGPDVASGVQLLLSGEHADPRAAQAVILLPVFLEILLRQLTGAARSTAGSSSARWSPRCPPPGPC